jgi:hypothetical protein
MSGMPKPNKILVIGSDDSLPYLLQRFGEQIGLETVVRKNVSDLQEGDWVHLRAIIFSDLVQLQAARSLVDEISTRDVLVVVCVSQVDELHARELGVDVCLLHPLSYADFCAAVRAS